MGIFGKSHKNAASKKYIWIIAVLFVTAGCFLGRSMAAEKPDDFQNDFSSDENAEAERESPPKESIPEGEETAAAQEAKSTPAGREAAVSGKEMMEQYYGVYEIKEYFGVNDSNKGANSFCNLPDEEIDLLIGQRIVLAEEKYAAYDNFRLGGRSGDRDTSDYQIKKYVIDDPEYTVREIDDDEDILCVDGKDILCLDGYYWENGSSDNLEYPYKVIELPNQEDLAESSRMTEFVPHLFVIDDRRLMWCCETALQWFIIEKVADVYEKEDICLPSEENGQIPAEMCGSYKITEFYPTVYWENRKAYPDYGRGYLSPEDAQSMIGRTVFLGEESYQGYTFDSSSFVTDEPERGPKIIAVDSNNTDYLVRDVKRSELYGLRDSILPEIYEQDVYREITVPVSMLSQDLEPADYFCNTKYYQLDTDNSKILMLFMKEFFLLEKED